MFNVNVIGSPMWCLCLKIIYLSTYLCCKCITYVMGTFVCQLVSMLIEIPMLGLITFIFFYYSIQLPNSQERTHWKKKGGTWNEWLCFLCSMGPWKQKIVLQHHLKDLHHMWFNPWGKKAGTIWTNPHGQCKQEHANMNQWVQGHVHLKQGRMQKNGN